MKISIVIHGPEVIDSGEAKIILEKLSRLGEVKAELGGTMGKTAVLDAGLENVIDITRHLKPSVCIEYFFETADLICLLNRGKTFETGKIFGSKVASRLKDREKKPVIQIGSPESSFGRIIPLNKKAENCIEKFSRALGIPAEEPLPFHNPVSIENCPKTGENRIIREISGVLPVENIFVNGIVIGKALSSKVRIISENGFITAIEGGEIKEHGLEKLHNYEKRDPVDLEKAWIKSGEIRRSNSLLPNAQKQSAAYARKSGCSFRTGAGNVVPGKVVLIDHIAERTFELAAGAELVATVGDDTTEIAGDILYRLGIPILGNTDGDCDEVVCQTELFPGSVVLRLAEGNDDVLGKKVKEELLGGENSAVLDVCAFKEDVMKLAEPLIEDVFEY